tara:strand:+ start:459 stop:1034 length:576 start_codon:yes stop_codon:yes gene_type:complete
MITQRFNSDKKWWSYNQQANSTFIGLTHLINDLAEHFQDHPHSKKMIEIGSYMGESTFLFGCSGIFDEINAIEPHKGDEPFNNDFDITWKQVKKEFKMNIRNFENIKHWKNFSEDIAHKFDDDIDFVYIDANHTYESVKKDLQLYRPKVKINGVIGGHDYVEPWSGVIQAVDETIGKPDMVHIDGSWIKYL